MREFATKREEATGLRKVRMLAGAPYQELRRECLRKFSTTFAAVSFSNSNGQDVGLLGEQWQCDPTHASHIVADLVKAGFAVRPRDPLDGRCRLVTLTDAGVAVKEAIVLSAT